MNVSEAEKVLTDTYYWVSMYKAGAVPEDLALEQVKEALLGQPQLNDNQKIKTNNNLLKINDLAFELQHGTVLTNEQWEKVEKIYKLSLMGDEEEE